GSKEQRCVCTFREAEQDYTGLRNTKFTSDLVNGTMNGKTQITFVFTPIVIAWHPFEIIVNPKNVRTYGCRAAHKVHRVDRVPKPRQHNHEISSIVHCGSESIEHPCIRVAMVKDSFDMRIGILRHSAASFKVRLRSMTGRGSSLRCVTCTVYPTICKPPDASSVTFGID